MARATDPKTSVRWTPENHAWLTARAVQLGVGIGTVVQAIVTAERQASGSATSTQVNGGGEASVRVPGQVDLMEALEESLTPASIAARSAAAAGSVPGGAAPVPRPGAVPARKHRLDVVVARVIEPGAGPIAPVTRARALRMIKDGKVDVSGIAAGTKLDPSMHVGAGEVVVNA